jgi:hypothetical protein
MNWPKPEHTEGYVHHDEDDYQDTFIRKINRVTQKVTIITAEQAHKEITRAYATVPDPVSVILSGIPFVTDKVVYESILENS